MPKAGARYFETITQAPATVRMPPRITRGGSRPPDPPPRANISKRFRPIYRDFQANAPRRAQICQSSFRGVPREFSTKCVKARAISPAPLFDFLKDTQGSSGRKFRAAREKIRANAGRIIEKRPLPPGEGPRRTRVERGKREGWMRERALNRGILPKLHRDSRATYLAMKKVGRYQSQPGLKDKVFAGGEKSS